MRRSGSRAAYAYACACFCVARVNQPLVPDFRPWLCRQFSGQALYHVVERGAGQVHAQPAAVPGRAAAPPAVQAVHPGPTARGEDPTGCGAGGALLRQSAGRGRADQTAQTSRQGQDAAGDARRGGGVGYLQGYGGQAGAADRGAGKYVGGVGGWGSGQEQIVMLDGGDGDYADGDINDPGAGGCHQHRHHYH